jgi:CO/xanthine dehydrogenase FAD-binding subunit
MRAFLPDYDMEAPASLDAALRVLADGRGEWKPFAGGTDLMVLLEAGKLARGRYVSLWGLDELRGISVSDAGVTIGALATYSEVLAHPVLGAEFPLLVRAAAETGGVATQNRGTIGGNIANASPAADTPPALLVYDAELELVSVRGTRRVPYDGFHSGYKVMDLAPDEIIQRIRLPFARRGWRQAYRKVGTRRAQAISKVCFAAAADVRDGTLHDIRIAFGSVAPTVVRAHATEAALRGRPLDAALPGIARHTLTEDIAPIDDVRSTARYRLRVAGNLLAEFLLASSGEESDANRDLRGRQV